MITNIVRRARKHHVCEAYGEHYIRPGHRYIDSRLSPDEDAAGGAWTRMACCRRCAERYQLGELFGPVVTVQTLAEHQAAIEAEMEALDALDREYRDLLDRHQTDAERDNGVEPSLDELQAREALTPCQDNQRAPMLVPEEMAR